MACDTYIFKRTEKKYLLTQSQYSQLLAIAGDRLTPDSYPESTVSNIYFDTPDFLLIRNSIDAVSYKEKLRLRCYGEVLPDSKAFFELKKKYNGVVYKRRIASTVRAVQEYLDGGNFPEDSQIMREIDYAMRFYKHPKPAVILSYRRRALCSGDPQSTLRITFDTDIRYRFDDLDILHGRSGTALIDENSVLMEIKTDGGVPLWLAHALDVCKIFPTKFSKYGTAYQRKLSEQEN